MSKTEPPSVVKAPVDRRRIQDLIRQLDAVVERNQRAPDDLDLFEGSKAYRSGYLQGIREVVDMLKRLLG